MHDDNVVLSESLVSVSLVWLGSVEVMDWTVVVGVDVDTGDSLRSFVVVDVVSYSSSYTVPVLSPLLLLYLDALLFITFVDLALPSLLDLGNIVLCLANVSSW